MRPAEVEIEVPRGPERILRAGRGAETAAAAVGCGGGGDLELVWLYGQGLTTGEICAHYQEVYGASLSRDTVSRITDRVIEDMQTW